MFRFVSIFFLLALANAHLEDCTVEVVQVFDTCYHTCGKTVTVMQRIVSCPFVEVPCGLNGTLTACPPPPLPPSPSPPSPTPPPYPPSPPPPAKGFGSCSWFCNPCDNCKKNPLSPDQCIFFGGANGFPLGNCTVKEDCIFGNAIIRKGDNLDDKTIMGNFAAPPDQWTCIPDTNNNVNTCNFGECADNK